MSVGIVSRFQLITDYGTATFHSMEMYAKAETTANARRLHAILQVYSLPST